jgi:transposase-like protein
MGTSAEHGPGAQISARGVRTRKRRSIHEKIQIVQETLSDESVAIVARRHGVNANQVFLWRRQHQRGELRAGPGARARETVILPVHVAQPPQDPTPGCAIEAGRLSSGAPRIEIEMAEGPRVKIWDISSETLRAIIRDLVRPC